MSETRENMPARSAAHPLGAPTTDASDTTSRGTITRDLNDDLGFQLVRASTTSTRRMRATLQPIGLRARTFSALALAVTPGSLGQRELAARLLLDPSQIVPIVDELEQRGLVERIVDPADRRGRLIRATDSGRELHAEARRRIDSEDPGDAASLTKAERKQLLTLLRRIADA